VTQWRDLLFGDVTSIPGDGGGGASDDDSAVIGAGGDVLRSMREAAAWVHSPVVYPPVSAVFNASSVRVPYWY